MEKAIKECDNSILVAKVQPDSQIFLDWQIVKESVTPSRQKLDAEFYDAWIEQPADAFLTLGNIGNAIRLSPSLEYLSSISAWFSHEVLANPKCEELRGDVDITLSEADAKAWADRAPMISGAKQISAESVIAFVNLLKAGLKNVLESNDRPVEKVLSGYAHGSILSEDRIHFHLVENLTNPLFPFIFMATCLLKENKYCRGSVVTLSCALEESNGKVNRLVGILSSLEKAGAKSPVIKALIDTLVIFYPVKFTAEDALSFLKDVSFFEECGIICRIPKLYGAEKRTVKLDFEFGKVRPGSPGIKGLIECNPVLQVDGERLTIEDVRRIKAQYDGFSLINGKWINVDQVSLERCIALFEKASALGSEMSVSFADAMRMIVAKKVPFVEAPEMPDFEVRAGAWLKSVLNKLSNASTLECIDPPKGLRIELYQYQKEGLAWLYLMHQFGIGCCLADGMGLGKTIQIIALILLLKERGDEEFGPTLLIVPASIIGNWQYEISRNAPDIKLAIAHSGFTTPEELEKLPEQASAYDIVIATYAMVRTSKWIAEKPWYYVIAEEAQQIKNPEAGQTLAIKKLSACHRVVMSGTPIENSLEDLWSLFDFINPGLLGDLQGFRAFEETLQIDTTGYARLKEVLRPFILRRLKTDKNVAPDLPEKINVKVTAFLAPEQAVLYQRLTDEMFNKLPADKVTRKKIILSYIVRFKQVCDHVCLLTKGSEWEETASGKWTAIRDICEKIRDEGEQVLVFTQFTELIPHLDDFLYKIFKQKGLCLTGDTPIKNRKELVDRFQNPKNHIPYFILSLKVGGSGHNLQLADHVIHLDSWWNPAVMEQAEDRAHRIGRKRTVTVHTLITKGTIEEKLDALLEAKRDMADRILTTKIANQITSLSNKELRKMFTLTLTKGSGI